MSPEQFHFLNDLINENPLAAAAIAVGIPLLLGLLFLGTLRRVHPVLIWLSVAAPFYGFSQVFPENPSQKRTHLIEAGVSSALMVGYWCWRIAPGIRKKFRLGGARELPLERRL